MIKYILSVVFILAVLNLTAQDKTYSFPIDRVVSKPITYVPVGNIRFLARDTVSNFDTLYTIEIEHNQDVPVKYRIRQSFDSVSGTPTADIILQGRNFDSDAWVHIDTISWKGTTSDTTIIFEDIDTARYYMQFREYIDAESLTTQKFLLDEIEIKIWTQ